MSWLQREHFIRYAATFFVFIAKTTNSTAQNKLNIVYKTTTAAKIPNWYDVKSAKRNPRKYNALIITKVAR